MISDPYLKLIYIYAVVIPGTKFTDDVCIGTVCARGIGIAEVEKYKDLDTGIIGLGFSESAVSRQLIVRKNILIIKILCKNFS